MSPSRRRAIPIAALVAAGVLYAWWSGPEPPPPAPSAAALPEVDTSAPALAIPSPLPAPPGDDAPVAFPELTGLGGRAADAYRERARFPPWSYPLADGRDPVREERIVEPSVSLPRDLVPGLVVSAEKTGFVSPEPVVVFASLRDGDTPVPPATLVGEIRDARDTWVADLDFRDDGTAPDTHPRDGTYAARVDAPPPGENGWRGAYLVSVSATTDTGELRAATAGFLYSVPLARLTGAYRDAIDDGDLVVEAELEVDAASRFHVEATLHDAEGTPRVWAQAASTLPPGRHWLPIRFDGLALRESGRDGPYTVGSLALSTVDGIPNQKSALERDVHETRAYDALDFDGTPYGDPKLLEAAERLEGRR